VAFVVVSLVGMPTQDVSAAIVFWTVAYWFVSSAAHPLPVRPLERYEWLMMTAAVVAFVFGTAALATTDLRVPARAREIGWPFSYGFYGPELDDQGREYRWAAGRATAVVDAPARWGAVFVRVNHLDIGARPVRAKVWADGRLIIDAVLSSTDAIRGTFEVHPPQSSAIIDTWVSRVVRPREHGVADDRELGLQVRWMFGPTPSGP
jgi:hypothetical protein